MFKKIVSQLSFSPALVGQLGFYAKRLRKEQTTRRIGLIFVALALVVQSLVVFQAPEPANAANPGDMIPGGLGLGANRSFNNFLGPYDRNERNLKDIYNYFGITREEITATKFTTFRVGDKIGWGFENRAGATAVGITNGSGAQVTTLYGRPLNIAPFLRRPAHSRAGRRAFGLNPHSTAISFPHHGSGPPDRRRVRPAPRVRRRAALLLRGQAHIA